MPDSEVVPARLHVEEWSRATDPPGAALVVSEPAVAPLACSARCVMPTEAWLAAWEDGAPVEAKAVPAPAPRAARLITPAAKHWALRRRSEDDVWFMEVSFLLMYPVWQPKLTGS